MMFDKTIWAASKCVPTRIGDVHSTFSASDIAARRATECVLAKVYRKKYTKGGTLLILQLQVANWGSYGRS